MNLDLADSLVNGSEIYVGDLKLDGLHVFSEACQLGGARDRHDADTPALSAPVHPRERHLRRGHSQRCRDPSDRLHQLAVMRHDIRLQARLLPAHVGLEQLARRRELASQKAATER